jgi:hypothetical protein
MENKTPMQELIEWNNSRDRYSMITWIELNAKLTELLEKEKQVIGDAFISGILHEKQNKKEQDYYNEKINNNGK